MGQLPKMGKLPKFLTKKMRTLERGKNEWKGTVHEIKQIHLPEDWEWNHRKSGDHKASELGAYDLAILVMKTPFIFTMKVKPINIHIEQKHIRELKGNMYVMVNDLTFYNKVLISILSFSDKEKCDVAGWGHIGKRWRFDPLYNKNQSNFDGELQEVLAPIVEFKRCAKMWEDDRRHHKITNKTICAGGLDARDACIVCTKL